jgi:type IV secretory pathway VirB10-like protein
MEILPRIKSQPQVGSTLHTPATKNMSISEIAETVQEPEEKKVTQAAPTDRFEQRQVIFIFAIIIITLIVLIMYLIWKNTKYFDGVKSKFMKPADPPKPLPKTDTHADIVHNTSDEEIAKFAALPTEPSPPEPTPTEPAPAENESTNTPKIEVMSDEARISTVVDQTEAATDKPESAITAAVEAEVAKIEAENKKIIEQVNAKTDVVIAVFNSSDEVWNANFDYDQVMACCRGEAKTYKKFKWRLQN